jgi:hypothetical protein
MILQMAQHCGVKVAENFFATSGEAERKGSQEGIRGQVECVIAFTSKEVAEGSALRECESKWFNLKFEKGTPLDAVYSKFFDKLFRHIDSLERRMDLLEQRISRIEANSELLGPLFDFEP